MVVDEKLKVNIYDFDDSYLKLSRLPTNIYYNTSCKKIDIIKNVRGHRSCEEYNAFVATMNWMDPLPSVGAIYQGLTLRKEKINDGFRIILDNNRHN